MDDVRMNSKALKSHYFLGVDVQIKRPCTYYVLDQDLEYVRSGSFAGNDINEINQNLRSLAKTLIEEQPGGLAIGIDAPRMGLTAPRPWYWRGGAWVPRSSRDKGFGRHCEVVVKALGLGNPQWTRMESDSPEWMKLGYRLFEVVEDLADVYEVFPSASYRMLDSVEHPSISLCLNGFAGQVKDMLDAFVAAYTVWALLNKRGIEVGGGDGFGSIALPEKQAVPATHPVLHWPSSVV